jgi:hypothetical protein
MAAGPARSSVSRADWCLRAVLTALLVGVITPTALTGADEVTASALKAALLYNFAKFVEWPALPAGGPMIFCIIGNDAIAAVLVRTVRGQSIGGHALEVRPSQDSGAWRACNLLFIGDADTSRSAGASDAVKSQPVLTVSDGNGFAKAGGIIELYVEGGRMRFAINVDAAERSGLRISSRLLGLAKVIRDGHVQ